MRSRRVESATDVRDECVLTGGMTNRDTTNARAAKKMFYSCEGYGVT